MVIIFLTVTRATGIHLSKRETGTSKLSFALVQLWITAVKVGRTSRTNPRFVSTARDAILSHRLLAARGGQIRRIVWPKLNGGTIP